jgi:DNA primase
MNKTNWIDIEELKKQLDFSEVLRHYGVELKLKGDRHHGFCPLPLHKGKKNSASFSANVKRGIWQCFGCGQKGNILEFAVLMAGLDPKNGEAVWRIAFGLQKHFLKRSSQAELEEKPAKESDADNIVINAPLDFELKGLDPSHPYLINRGFTAETIERFGLGYCSRGLLANRIAIPLHDAEGKLLGYAGRVTDDEAISEENPRYKFPGRRKRKGVIHEFRKSTLVYRHHLRNFNEDNDLIVVEGFASVWWLTQAGLTEVVATMGASCSAEQRDAILSLVWPNRRLFIFTDGDAAGDRCAQEIFAHVGPHRFVRWIRLKDGKQPTDFSPAELWEVLDLWNR